MTLAPSPEAMPVDLEGKGQPLVDKTFRWILFLCLAVGIFFLAVLLAYVTIKGWPRLTPTLWENMPSIRRPERAGATPDPDPAGAARWLCPGKRRRNAARCPRRAADSRPADRDRRPDAGAGGRGRQHRPCANRHNPRPGAQAHGRPRIRRTPPARRWGHGLWQPITRSCGGRRTAGQRRRRHPGRPAGTRRPSAVPRGAAPPGAGTAPGRRRWPRAQALS